MTTQPRQVSEAGLKLVMAFEGYRRDAARLADGRWTLGYGHTRSARAGAKVSEADARALLVYDLRETAKALEPLITAPIGQNQFDALAAFAFAIGLDNFRHSAVLRLVNAGAALEAADSMERWRRAEIGGQTLVLDALVRRRAAEKALFLTPDAGPAPIPSAVAPARLDHHGDGVGEAVEVHVPLTGERAFAERPGAPTAHAEPAPVLGPDPEPIGPFPTEPAAAAAPTPEALPALPEVTEGAAPQTWIVPHVESAPMVEPNQPALAEPAARPPLRDRFGEFDYAIAEPESGDVWRWAGVGLVGVIIFALALFWALSAKGPPGPLSPQVIGALLALAGVACVVSAVYALIQRYLGREE